MAHSIWEFDQYFRNEIKYTDNLTDEQSEAYEHIREKLRKILNEHDVKIEI
jgi:hypothetical protein